MLVGHWTDSLDRAQLDRVLAGEDPFDETTMLDADERELELAPADDSSATSERQPLPA